MHLPDDEDDWLPKESIFAAAKQGDLQFLKQLIESGLATVTDLNSRGTSALHIAARHGQAEICRYLLDKGASYSQLDEEYGLTAVHWAASHVNVIRTFVDCGVDLTVRNKFRGTILHETIHPPSFLSLLYVLQAIPDVDVNSPDNLGCTPLMFAALWGEVLLLDLLLRHGADPNARAPHGETPLHFAINGRPNNSIACIRKLIMHGANPKAKDHHGRTPKHDAKHLNRQGIWKQGTKKQRDHEESFRMVSRITGGYMQLPTFSLPSDSFDAYSVLEGATEHSNLDVCSCCNKAVSLMLKPLQNPDRPLDEKLRIVFLYLTNRIDSEGASLQGQPDQIFRAILIGELLLTPLQCSEKGLHLTFTRSPERFLAALYGMSSQSVMEKKLILRRLAKCFNELYIGTDDLQYVDTAIAICRKCMAVATEDIPCDSSLLCTFLSSKFERQETNDPGVINEALIHGRDSLQGSYKDHPIHCYRLASALHSRYTSFYREQDIDDGISLMRHAVAIVQNSSNLEMDRWKISSEQGLLSVLQYNLAFLLRHKVPLKQDAEAIASECVDVLRQAVLAEPISNVYRIDLASALHKKFMVVTRDVADIDEAISLLGQIMVAENVSDSLRMETMASLGEYIYERYRKCLQIVDLDTTLDILQLAQEYFQNAKRKFKDEIETQLATAYWKRYRLLQKESDCERAFRHMDLIRQRQTVQKGDRLVIAIQDFAPAYHIGGRYADALSEYRIALELLPSHLFTGRNYRSNPVVGGWDVLGANAAAAGAAGGAYKESVELLEAGRGIGWSKGLQMRSGITQLKDEYPELAQRFEELGKSLEKTELSHSLQETPEISAAEVISGKGSEEEQFQLQLQWDALLQEIRSLNGYQDFLLQMKYEELRKVAEHGPVVIINISEYRSDAFIIADSTSDQPELVPLVQDLHILTSNWADDLFSAREKLENAELTDDDFSRRILKPLVRDLWQTIVEPIRKKLDILSPDVRRLWWVPTRRLTFLPLHMATNGPVMGSHASGVVAELIPSYAITLTSLLRARPSADIIPSTDVLMVGCASPADLPNLPPLDTKTEIQAISKILAKSKQLEGNVLSLQEEDATVQATLSQMQQHTWLHLACHGIQSSDKPYESHFALHDGNLHMAAIAGVRLESAQLAFLSACQTATGIPALGDEAMHLAAGLHFAGFCATVATMWSVDDEVARSLSKLFYKYLVEKQEGSLSVTDTAEALWYATRKLQRKGVSLSLLAPFIHIGL